MIQWIGLGLTLIGVLVNGYQKYSSQPLTMPVPKVEYYQQQAVRYYQAAFDPNTGKIYLLFPDGKWYEQVPQIRADQTQHQANLANWQGSQPAPVGQRIAQQQTQTAPNPWFR